MENREYKTWGSTFKEGVMVTVITVALGLLLA